MFSDANSCNLALNGEPFMFSGVFFHGVGSFNLKLNAMREGTSSTIAAQWSPFPRGEGTMFFPLLWRGGTARSVVGEVPCFIA
jgi:hypothetical protein